MGHSHLNCGANGSPCRVGMGPYRCCCNTGFSGNDCSIVISSDTIVFKKILNDGTDYLQGGTIGYAGMSSSLQDQLFHSCYYPNIQCGSGNRYPKYGCYRNNVLEVGSIDLCLGAGISIPTGYVVSGNSLQPSPMSMLDIATVKMIISENLIVEISK